MASVFQEQAQIEFLSAMGNGVIPGIFENHPGSGAYFIILLISTCSSVTPSSFLISDGYLESRGGLRTESWLIPGKWLHN